MTRPVKLFASTDKAAAHAKLEEVLALGVYPSACCREDTNNTAEPYTVWSNNEVPTGWEN
jgi:hypothetical protein